MNRSKTIEVNVIASFLIKGWSALILLVMVPLTLKCLGTYQNGVWLTISSMLVWIDQMDIGLGNGLRNKLAIHIAHDEWKEARKIVSSTFAMLFCIIIPVLIFLLFLIYQFDIYAFLNIIPTKIPELRLAMLCAITLVCMTFILKFIGNVYMGMQMPAVSNLLMTLGQTVALIGTWLVYITGESTFLAIVLVNTASPLLIYLLSYPYTFFHQFPQLRPTIRMVNMQSALELGNLGVKFFWLQVAGVLQFMTANILISKFFTPEMVTPYQIAYRYMSLVMVVFSIICMPFWNATTDAYERGDIKWILKANKKMSLMTFGFAVLIAILVLTSPWIYQLWIGDACDVPYGMTIMMGIYIFLMVDSMRYSFFLNGIGALRLQLYMTVMTVIFIPLAWYVSKTSHNILWFMAVMCFCISPSIIVNKIQFNKILKGTAKGVWRI
jgi:O-antigen/teichoic acid export membrane protein